MCVYIIPSRTEAQVRMGGAQVHDDTDGVVKGYARLDKGASGTSAYTGAHGDG